MRDLPSRRWWMSLAFVVLVYLHNTLPHLTMMPRVNVDEPWLMERAYQVWRAGIPSQPMLGLHQAYLLQVGYGYLLAPWFGLFGVGLFQARLFGVILGLGIVLMVASIGRRTVDPITGLCAALFLALDSNFLGGARNARTDIPSVFFVTAALAAYLAARERSRPAWFAVSGAAVGLAMLCHGNAFWVAAILAIWFLLDDGRRVLAWPFAYSFAGGLLATFGPYLAAVAMRWKDVQIQIGNFAGDRVPSVNPAFVLQQMARELERYRYWYFGLVTNLVPNPLLLVFQAATVVGVIALAVRSVSVGRRTFADPRGPIRLLILAAGCVLIFAAFINNKVPVYLPHILVGFALAAGFAVSEVVTLVRASRPAAAAFLLFFVGYGAAGVAYYGKWYSSVRKSELVPYESTEATLLALVPTGHKYVFASPQFWTPFHAQPGTTFYSYAAAQPIEAGDGSITLAGTEGNLPIYLIVDESQWLPELIGGISAPTTAWQQGWIHFIERCRLDGMALGTAHGTLALYNCTLGERVESHDPPPVRIVGGDTVFSIGEVVLTQTAVDLAKWARYEDPRRTASAQPDVSLVRDEGRTAALRIAGTGWPGITKVLAADPGEKYLVRVNTHNTRDGDLLYLGTWQQRQVQSLSGASSSGISAPIVREPWFPRDRAFIATNPQVLVRIYSEAPVTDFAITSLDVFRLTPRYAAASRP